MGLLYAVLVLSKCHNGSAVDRRCLVHISACTTAVLTNILCGLLTPLINIRLMPLTKPHSHPIIPLQFFIHPSDHHLSPCSV